MTTAVAKADSRKPRRLVVHIDVDQDPINPLDRDQWKVISFGRRHSNYEDPDKYVKGIKDGKPVPIDQALRNKLRAKTAFWLGYYEHGDCQWALSGEQHQCQWDSVSLAGLLLWEGKASEISPEHREAQARSILEEYTAYCNGHVYCFAVETEDGEPVDSCGGFTDTDYLAEMIKEAVGDAQVVYRGQAKDLAQYFKNGPQEVEDDD